MLDFVSDESVRIMKDTQQHYAFTYTICRYIKYLSTLPYLLYLTSVLAPAPLVCLPLPVPRAASRGPPTSSSSFVCLGDKNSCR